MHEVTLTIEPNEKYRAVVEGEFPGDEVPDSEEEWREQHPAPDAADAYVEAVGGAPTEDELVPAKDRLEDLGGGEYRISCRHCDTSWRMTDDTPTIDAREELADRLESHRPCGEGALSWDMFSPASDPDLLAKIATYFDGIEPDEPGDRIAAKLRLLDCEVYANAQIAARQELLA